METGDIVKIRFKRYFSSQKLWIFVGKVVGLTENWVEVDGKGILFTTGQLDPLDIDKELRVLAVPRENIAHIRVLPNNFNLEKIETYKTKFRWYIKVDGGADASLGEMGETA